MENDFEKLYEEVIKNNYIKTIDDEIYLPSKNEMKLIEKGFDIDGKIIEKLLMRYKTEIEKENNNKSSDKSKSFIKENWFKISIIVILVVSLYIYITFNRYTFIQEESYNRFAEDMMQEVKRCDKFTGKCEEIK